MLRKVLCNYEFSQNGIPYKGYGLYLEDTSNPKTVKYKDYSCQVVCLVLKRTPEELSKIVQCKYWDINRAKLERVGFKISMLEVYFYPGLDKGG
jgi:hypothetical protein